MHIMQNTNANTAGEKTKKFRFRGKNYKGKESGGKLSYFFLVARPLPPNPLLVVGPQKK